jgi:hypothetical protein
MQERIEILRLAPLALAQNDGERWRVARQLLRGMYDVDR